jgi:hypothetical protein
MVISRQTWKNPQKVGGRGQIEWSDIFVCLYQHFACKRLNGRLADVAIAGRAGNSCRPFIVSYCPRLSAHLF